MDDYNMPLGLGFALAQRPEAMKKFSALSEAERDEILRKAHYVNSKAEMQALVSQLSSEN